jgi:predicted DNA-binding protein
VEQKEILNKADLLAAMATGNVQMDTKGQVVPFMVRVPIWVAAKVDSLAKQLGKSRAATVSYLLDVGLEEVHQRLDQATLEKLMLNEAEAFEVLKAGESSSEGF